MCDQNDCDLCFLREEVCQICSNKVIIFHQVESLAGTALEMSEMMNALLDKANDLVRLYYRISYPRY